MVLPRTPELPLSGPSSVGFGRQGEGQGAPGETRSRNVRVWGSEPPSNSALPRRSGTSRRPFVIRDPRTLEDEPSLTPPSLLSPPSVLLARPSTVGPHQSDLQDRRPVLNPRGRFSGGVSIPSSVPQSHLGRQDVTSPTPDLVAPNPVPVVSRRPSEVGVLEVEIVPCRRVSTGTTSV